MIDPKNIKHRVWKNGQRVAYIDDAPLVCFGCAHSAVSFKYPSQPSGERPCMFCIRNPEYEDWNKQFKEMHGQRYDVQWNDGTPLVEKPPFDAYIGLGRLMEERHLREVAATNGQAPEPTIEDTMDQMRKYMR